MGLSPVPLLTIQLLQVLRVMIQYLKSKHVAAASQSYRIVPSDGAPVV
jgi:hypothetical protein